MLRLYRQIITAFLLLFLTIQLHAVTTQKNSENYNLSEYGELDIVIGYRNANGYDDISKIISIPDNSFQNFIDQKLSPDSVYWLKLNIFNHKNITADYVLHFNNTISEVEAYLFLEDTLYSYHKAGVLVPLSQRTYKGHLKDNIKLHLPGERQTVLFLKVRNELNYSNVEKYLIIVPKIDFDKNIKKTNLSTGIFMGSICLLIVFALILFGFSRDSLYLIYALYMIFIVGYFINALHITELGLFQELPRLNLYTEWSLYISQNLYFIFLSRILKKEKLVKKRIHVASILYFTLPLLVIMLITSFYNYSLARMMHYLYSIMCILIAIALVFVFYRKVGLKVRLIFIGTLCMVCGALIATAGLNPKFPGLYYSHMGFFQAGILIELFLFMIAVLYSFFDEIKLKHNIEKDQLKMQMEKLQKEKENILLKQEVDKTYRELASTSIKLTQKETIITDMMQKLSALKHENTNENELNVLINGLKQHLNNNSWTEFEYYFNQVNPGFYSALFKIHPDLTVNEKKICAYLKLNLNTKEIVSVSGKSLNSIEVARTRLRKKLGLEPYQNIYTYISNI